MKFLRKKLLFSLFLLINFSFIYSQNNINIKTKEDIEIEKIKNEIKILENKLKIVNEEKKEKKDKKLKIGLSLSGGGAKGYAHLGVLRVLEEENIKIDYISGTSVGALIGTLYSIGYSIDEIEKVLDTLNTENYLESGEDVSNLSLDKKESLKKYSFYIKFDNNFNYSLPKGFRNTEKMYLEIKKLLKDYEHVNSLDDLPIPVRIIATNLNTGETTAFKNGDIARILVASMAIPAVLEPVEIKNELYVDGLVSRNLPVQDTYDMGADIVIASDVGTAVTNKDNYNILSILNQMIAIQSNQITKEEREKASILITPEIKDITALDTSKKLELINLGKIAALKEINNLRAIPRSNKNKISLAKEKKKIENIILTKIIYEDDFDKNTKDLLDNVFAPLLNKSISEKEIEDNILKTYNLKYAQKIYYRVENNILYIEGESSHENKVGIGANYRTDYGLTLNLGTDLYFNGKLGNNLGLNVSFGDYLGVNLETLSYYGLTNKFGIFTNLGYNQTPYFLYNGNKRLAKYLAKAFFLNLGLFNQPNNRTMVSYGISSKIIDFNLDTGSGASENLEYSSNINKTYFRIKYDTLNSLSLPMEGVKVDFIYNLSNSFGNSKSNSYGPMYTIKGYVPINKKMSFLYGLNSAIIRGENIKPDQYIKLGGMYNNLDNNEFEFYGFNLQQKSVEEFLSLSLGLRYKLLYSLYLTGKFNVTTFKDNIYTTKKNEMWKDYSKGLGLSLGYDSPIGPLEFSISSDLDDRKPVGTISIGYKLD